jgi:PII-like signaling protein
MQGSFLRFYVQENHRVHGRPVWEWLLEQANTLGIRGGSAFKAMAGFGHHHRLHESKFFELAGSGAVEVEFIVNDTEAAKLLARLEQEDIRLFHARIPATFSVMHPDADDPPGAADGPQNGKP